VDRLLDDEALLRPIRQKLPSLRGLPSIPLETYLWMMYLKRRYRVGFEALVKEVADILVWRGFCRLNLTDKVPDATTLIKLTHRLGPSVIRAPQRPSYGQARRGEGDEKARPADPGGHHGEGGEHPPPSANRQQYALSWSRGETLSFLGLRPVIETPFMLIPRFVWPGKPVRPGGRDITDLYSGNPPGMETSTAITLYGDFNCLGGWPFEVVGWFVWGCLTGWLYRRLVLSGSDCGFTLIGSYPKGDLRGVAFGRVFFCFHLRHEGRRSLLRPAGRITFRSRFRTFDFDVELGKVSQLSSGSFGP